MVRIIVDAHEWTDLRMVMDALIKSNWKAADVIHEEAAVTVAEQKSLARVRTGFMRAHINYIQRGDGAMIFSPAPYSGYLEFGTRFMRPAPFFIAPLEKMADRLRKRYNTIWSRIIR